MQKITEIYERNEESCIFIGGMKIMDGISKNRVWIENEEGEGGDFPTEDIEKMLRKYFNKHF